MKWASREITSCFLSRQAAGFHFSHKEDLEAWQKRRKWELPLRTIQKIWTSTDWVAHRSTDGHKWPPITPCRPLPSNNFSSCQRNFVYLTYIWPGTFFNTSSQIYLTIHTLVSSLSLLLECEATDCIWHTGVIGIVTMCLTPSWTGCIYGRLIRLLSSFWSFCPLLVSVGKQHLCSSVTGIFTGQEADVVGIIGSPYWLGLESLCLVFWIVREESGGWKKRAGS